MTSTSVYLSSRGHLAQAQIVGFKSRTMRSVDMPLASERHIYATEWHETAAMPSDEAAEAQRNGVTLVISDKGKFVDDTDNTNVRYEHACTRLTHEELAMRLHGWGELQLAIVVLAVATQRGHMAHELLLH